MQLFQILGLRTTENKLEHNPGKWNLGIQGAMVNGPEVCVKSACLNHTGEVKPGTFHTFGSSALLVLKGVLFRVSKSGRRELAIQLIPSLISLEGFFWKVWRRLRCNRPYVFAINNANGISRGSRRLLLPNKGTSPMRAGEGLFMCEAGWMSRWISC